MPTGKLVYWNEPRGFGRLTDDADRAGPGVFLHITAAPDRVAPVLG